jgi:hypothetical protein
MYGSWRETDLPTFVELRVHGVSGTPPEDLLRLPSELIERVYGDGDAGFYRARTSITIAAEYESMTSLDLQRPETSDYTTTEAFSWGGLTSGPASRALWLLFLPFIFINLAHWMLPPTKCPPGKRPIGASASVCLLRLLGLSLTLTLLLAAAVALIDVVGWQCVGNVSSPGVPSCASKLGPLEGMKTWHTGWVLVAAASPIAGLVLALLVIGRSNPRLGDLPPDPADARPGTSPLSTPSFWNIDLSIARLRDCHIAAWFSALGLLVLLGPGITTVGSDQCVDVAFMLGNGALLFLACLATWSKRWTARGNKPAPVCASNCTKALWILSLAMLVVSSLRVGLTYPAKTASAAKTPSPALPGIDTALCWLVAVQATLLVLLFLAIWQSKATVEKPRRGYEYSLKGMTAWFVATIACLLGGAISIGIGLWLARFLGRPVAADGTSTTETPIVLSPIYFYGALANPIFLVGAAIAAVVVYLCVKRAAKLCEEKILAPEPPGGYPEVGDLPLKPTKDEVKAFEQACDLRLKRLRSIASTWAWAGATDKAPAIIAGLVGYTAVDLVASYLLCSRWRPAPQSLVGAISASVALTSFLMAVFIGLAYRAFRQRQTRRSVGVLWDVMTFWPQAAHPFGPPCYGQRAVPDLRDRVDDLSWESAVVLAAHSQGSIITAAALLLQTPPTRGSQKPTSDTSDSSDGSLLRERVAFLSFGSPLRRLYARNFPAYFGFDVLRTIAADAPERWINLWAHTDPIGGWVFSKSETLIERDPSAVDRWLRDAASALPSNGTYPPICLHSGFWLRDEYVLNVYVLAGQIAGPSSPTAKLEHTAARNLLRDPTGQSKPRSLMPLRLPGATE